MTAIPSNLSRLGPGGRTGGALACPRLRRPARSGAGGAGWPVESVGSWRGRAARFPGEVPGWLTAAEGLALYRRARGRHVLEVGSYCGRSTACLGQ